MISFSLKVALGLALTSIASHAVTVDFNSLAQGSIGTSYTSGNVTFVATDGGAMQVAQSPNGSNALIGSLNEPYSTVRATIAGGATFVSVDLGDFNSDADTIFLEVFNSANVSQGKVTQLLNNSFVGMFTLSIDAGNVAYAIFGSTAPSVDGSTVFADNFTYRASNVASAPDAGSTLGLMALSAGPAGLGSPLAPARRSLRQRRHRGPLPIL